MEVASPVDKVAPKILTIIKPNEISPAPQNNECWPNVVRVCASQVNISSDGKLYISNPNFVFMDNTSIKISPGVKLQKIVDTMEQKPKLESSAAIVAAEVDEIKKELLDESSGIIDEAIIESKPEIARMEFGASTVYESKLQTTTSVITCVSPVLANTRLRPQRLRFRHPRKPPGSRRVSTSDIGVIKCETAEDGKAVLSVNGILNSTLVSRKSRSRVRDPAVMRYKVSQSKFHTVNWLTTKNINIGSPRHDQSGEQVVCEKCGIVFQSTDPFHKCEYASNAMLKCELCGLKFETPLHYSQHGCRSRSGTVGFTFDAYTSRTKPNIRMLSQNRCLFRCKICTAVFKTSRQFLDHSRSHTGEKPYTCDTCLQTFKSRHRLDRHREVHIGVELHRCTVCGVAFRNALGLARHNQIHFNGQSHSCVKCGTKFATTDLLVQHSVLHDGEKPYMCCMCNATFYFAHNLDQHLRMSDCANKVMSK